MSSRHVVVLGAGASGVGAARMLASRGDTRVTLVARSDETPSTRMLITGVAFGPLPPEAVALPLPEVEFVADTANEVELGARRVRLASGARLGYDALIVATGSRPRGLPPELPGAAEASSAGLVHGLHSLDDALRLRERLAGFAGAARIAILGGGAIAAETASTLRAQGHTVILIARSRVPGIAAFGAPVAERLAAEHSARVLTRFGRSVDAVAAADGGLVIELDRGERVVADFALLAFGTEPSGPAPWADGVHVDGRLRADAPGVFGAGGVAVHRDEVLGSWRIDHWEDAAAQGAHAAQSVLHEFGAGADPGDYRPRSSYLAMVHGLVVSGVGAPACGEARLEDGEEFVARHELGGRVVGVSGIGAVGTVVQWSPRLHEASA
ncbi:FAD-dependent oxidoreductase [Agromyces mediolanus]|uniref:Ferredoxin reductase n=1 Tax=Agromyces mediolanus TaxID=41986 RepID=A0A918CC77_AGRME|nr:FAD-dependent oxidoreductase [Agromyces mediolanus]GGR17075.1 ferredoxin reductase [Agromyces mediolanus]GLJ71659.1 ferredoxin reductase [Agromyces mediolanus]